MEGIAGLGESGFEVRPVPSALALRCVEREGANSSTRTQAPDHRQESEHP
jgi:hypothetical protein